MKIVEKFVKGKFNKEELCEDGICVTENFIALIDGEPLTMILDIMEKNREGLYVIF